MAREYTWVADYDGEPTATEVSGSVLRREHLRFLRLRGNDGIDDYYGFDTVTGVFYARGKRISVSYYGHSLTGLPGLRYDNIVYDSCDAYAECPEKYTLGYRQTATVEDVTFQYTITLCIPGAYDASPFITVIMTSDRGLAGSLELTIDGDVLAAPFHLTAEERCSTRIDLNI